MCQGVFEIPAPPIPAVEKRKVRGKGKQAAAVTPAAVTSSTTTTTSTPASGSSAKVTPNEIKCEICEDDEEATSFCVPCSQFFCAGCQRAHKKPRVSAGHDFVSVEKALEGKEEPLVEGAVYRRDYGKVGDKPVSRLGSKGKRDGQSSFPYSVATPGETLLLLSPEIIAFRFLIEMASSC